MDRQIDGQIDRHTFARSYKLHEGSRSVLVATNVNSLLELEKYIIYTYQFSLDKEGQDYPLFQ